MDAYLNGSLYLNGENIITAMDASTTIEVQLADADHNFFLEKQYDYGEITICFLLIILIGMMFWKLLLETIESMRKK